MDCSRAFDLTSVAALGELRGPELAGFKRHLSMCPSCRAEFARAREILAGLKDKPDAAVPAHLVDRILAAGRRELKASRVRRRARVAASVVAAGILLCLGWWLRRPPAAKCTCWRFVGRDAGNSRTVRVEDGCFPERILWERALHGPRGVYKPLAWKDLVIVGTGPMPQGHSGGSLIALDAEGGRVRWSREFSSGDLYKAKGFPDRCIQSDQLCLTDGERCMVLEAATGEQVASLKPPSGVEGWGYLAASGPRLYGAARDGRTVFCLDAVSGRVIWCRAIKGSVFVPALCDERLYLHIDNGAVVALDALDGTPVWRRDAATKGGRGTVHAGGDQVVVLTEKGETVAFGARRGEVLWSRKVRGTFHSGLALGDEAVYLLAGSLALDVNSGRTMWRRSGTTSGICSAPTLVGAHVLVAAGREFGVLSVYDVSGELLATLEDSARWACDGVIVSRRRAYTVGGRRILALGCAAGG